MIYIDKLASFGTNGQLIISASTGGYGNTNYVLDDVRHGTGYGGAYSNTTDLDHTSDGASVWAATNGLIAAGVPSAATLLYDGLETCLQSDASSNCIVGSNITHVTGVSHMAGYICWGGHSSLGSDYARDNTVAWGANSGWWIIETIESYNGRRPATGGTSLSGSCTRALAGPTS